MHLQKAIWGPQILLRPQETPSEHGIVQVRVEGEGERSGPPNQLEGAAQDPETQGQAAKSVLVVQPRAHGNRRGQTRKSAQQTLGIDWSMRALPELLFLILT